MKGYKVFNKDWTCRGFQYEVGKTYKMEETPVLCGKGFHYCEKVEDCFNYYSFDVNNKIAEIEAVGVVVTEGDKSATNEILIVRELSWEEMLSLANTGKGNTGLRNSGNRNSGDSNSGNRNSGNRNSGYGNSGYGNSGNRNSGYGNSGYGNSGNRNSGDSNSGDSNSGYGNSGDSNSGNSNSGNRNSGYGNSGYGNSGNSNSGNRNSGYGNSGNRNSGDYNSGHFNLSDNNSGCFNQETHTIKMFDKDSEITLEQFERSEAWLLLCRIESNPTTWVWLDDMTDEEKKANKDCETLGGYLKKNDLTEVNQQWWNELTESKKKIIKDMPNFDECKFQAIMGINMEVSND